MQLSIASGDKNQRFGIAPVERADGSAALTVGLMRHAACVHHNNIRNLIAGNGCDAARRESIGDRSGLGEIQLAAETMIKGLQRPGKYRLVCHLSINSGLNPLIIRDISSASCSDTHPIGKERTVSDSRVATSSSSAENSA